MTDSDSDDDHDDNRAGHVHAAFEASLPRWVSESARVRCWYAIKERHPILSFWCVYDAGAPRATRSVVMYVEAVWMMALQALAFSLCFPPTLLAACTEYTIECDCTKLSRPFDSRAPACAWLEDGHTEDWSRDGCLDAPSDGACAYREPEIGDPYLLLVVMIIVTACNLPMHSGLEYLFDRITLAPVLDGTSLGTAEAAPPKDATAAQAGGGFQPQTVVDNESPASPVGRSVACGDLLHELPMPSAALGPTFVSTLGATDGSGRTPLHCLAA